MLLNKIQFIIVIANLQAACYIREYNSCPEDCNE